MREDLLCEKRKPCKKPPLGVEPRWAHEAQRINKLTCAIDRYMEEDEPIPVEWIEEYNELVKRKKARK